MAEFGTAEGRKTAGQPALHAREVRRPWAWAWTLPCRTGRIDPLGSGSARAQERTHLFDMEVIVRRQDQEHCASITCMIRHYVARRAQVTEGHPHNAAESASN